MVSAKNKLTTTDILDEVTVEKIKKELLARKEQINKDLEDISGDEGKPAVQGVKFPQYGDKSDENAQEASEYSTNLATEKVLESTLRDIEGTLERIENNTYGICKYCKEEIGEKRLLARPVASACIKCKTKLQSPV